MADEYVLPLKVIEKYKAELKDLRSNGRNDIAEKIKEAKSFGDLSENAEYDEAKSDQAKLEARIAELEYMLAHATVLDESALTTDKVETGLYVKVEDKTYNETDVYQIVGSPQANPIENRISDESPIGRTLLGHKIGDHVVVEAPTGNIELVVLEISKEDIN